MSFFATSDLAMIQLSRSMLEVAEIINSNMIRSRTRMTTFAACAEEHVQFRSISTGKERDAESGNDYFGARYYSSAMGRFMSPDWSAKVAPVPYAKLDNPQSLNLYAYVGNNPLVRTDPTGHYNTDCTAKAVSGCSQGIQNFEANRQKDLNSKSAKVRAAAAAYGGFNDGNKVNLKVDPSATSGLTKQDVKDGKRQDSVTVTMPTNGSKGLVAHEGSHVEDFNSVMSGAAPTTQYQTEMKAYETQAATLMDDYPSGTVGVPALMQITTGNVNMLLMQPFDNTSRGINDDAIKAFLANSPLYGLSEGNQGATPFVKP
jgi:RHS repeat-associated protein